MDRIRSDIAKVACRIELWHRMTCLHIANWWNEQLEIYVLKMGTGIYGSDKKYVT